MVDSLNVEELNTLDISPDGQICYGYKNPSNEDVVNKINELICKYNKLLEYVAILEVELYTNAKK